MKLQDLYPYDAAIWGLDGIYTPVGNDSFIINDQCITAKNNTITTGYTYVLAYPLTNGRTTIEEVELVDVYCDNILIHLVVKNVLFGNQFDVSLNVHETKLKCSFVLMDLKYVRSVIDRLMITDYCGCERQ